MKNNNLSAKCYDPFFLMAMTIPITEGALGSNWLPTAVTASVAALLNLWMATQEEVIPKWLSWARQIAIVILLGYFLRKTHSCWPGRGAEYVVPAVLLALAVYSTGKGANAAIQSANVLRYGMFLVLMVLLISGLDNLKWNALRPQAHFPGMELCIALLLPLIGRRVSPGKIGALAALALIVAVITAGTAAASLYFYSQGLSLRGITEHTESITACAVTVGYFALLCFLLDCEKKEWEDIGADAMWRLPAAAGTGYLLSLPQIQIREEIYVIFLIVLWVIAPIAVLLAKRYGKKEKTA